MSRPRLLKLDQKIGPAIAVATGVQHVLAMFVGIITPPLIICSSLGFAPGETTFVLSMALFTSGVTTFIQVRRFGRVGSGLLSVQGTSFNFVTVAIEAGKAGGLPLILGMALAASPLQMAMSRSVYLLRRLFPPVVTGSVVMMIGLSLIQIGMTDLAGGYGAPDFGSLRNLAIGMFVMVTIIGIHVFGPTHLGTVSIGLVAGYCLASLFGMIDFTPVFDARFITIPQPLYYGLDFQFAFLVPWCIAYFVTAIETVGDLTATSSVSEEPVAGPVYLKRLEGGILANGLGSLFSALFNAMPNSTFSQNNGVIRLTGVASRRTGYVVAALLVLLGLFPPLSSLLTIMPKPVLGGATTIMFGFVAVAGLRLVATDGITPRNEFILAITLALGLGTTMVPDLFSGVDPSKVGSPLLKQIVESMRIISQSGLAVAGITATILNLIIPRESRSGEPADEH